MLLKKKSCPGSLCRGTGFFIRSFLFDRAADSANVFIDLGCFL